LLLRYYQQLSVSDTAAVMGGREHVTDRRALAELKNMIGRIV
jgi:hypothetical protein